MKYIDLDFIPVKIPTKFSLAALEVDCSKKIKLFDKYLVSINLVRNWFNKTSVKFTFDENINVDEIDKMLICKYGEPKYITDSGLRTWKVDKVYIVHGEIEEQYQYVKHIITIMLFKPGFTINSDRYIQINKLFDKIAYTWSLKKISVSFVGITGEIFCFFENNNYQYLLTVEKKCLKMYSSEKVKEGNYLRLVPSWNEKVKYKKTEQLFSLINSYFTYMMDEDNELKNDDVNGIYIRDIIREGIKNDDQRLR